MDNKKLMEQFERHYKAHFDKVYRFIFWKIGTKREVAEDLTSEVWIKALSAYDKFEQGKPFLPWIITIARNHIINFYRKNGREVLESELASDTQTGREIMEWLGGRVDDHSAQDLYKAMSKLDEGSRQIVELKYLQGFSYKEIGEMIGEKEVTVKVAAHRAIKKLKSFFKNF